jgi:16S rRNA (guanine966-N2)-methyltransferase
MRVVAGSARGRRLVSPAGTAVRPTADRVKEALFSSLAPRLPGASVLDVFAGSGALGLEALSRGAARVTFIEQDRLALEAIRTNIATVALSGTSVVAGEAGRVLAGASTLAGAPFDLVLLDPPYALEEATLAALLTDVAALLSAGATVVVERAAGAPQPSWPATLVPAEPRRYGATALHRAVLLDGTSSADASDPARQERSKEHT